MFTIGIIGLLLVGVLLFFFAPWALVGIGAGIFAFGIVVTGIIPGDELVGVIMALSGFSGVAIKAVTKSMRSAGK